MVDERHTFRRATLSNKKDYFTQRMPLRGAQRGVKDLPPLTSGNISWQNSSASPLMGNITEDARTKWDGRLKACCNG